MNTSLEKLTKEFGYTRQCYYKRFDRYKKFDEIEQIVLAKVSIIRARQPRCGVRKLQRMVNWLLRSKGIRIGRDWLFDLLRRKALLVKKRRRGCRTTDSYHRFRIYKNLIKDTQPSGPNQIWVSDITYISLLGSFCYLFLITDLYSRKIVGYHLSNSLAVEGALKALKMAQRQCKTTKGLIHHSDRGIQYCCNAYVKQLKKKKMLISMTEEMHVYENAVAERVNGILKNEFMLGEQFVSFNQANSATKQAIKIYNEERLHVAIGYQTPEFKHAA